MFPAGCRQHLLAGWRPLLLILPMLHFGQLPSTAGQVVVFGGRTSGQPSAATTSNSSQVFRTQVQSEISPETVSNRSHQHHHQVPVHPKLEVKELETDKEKETSERQRELTSQGGPAEQVPVYMQHMTVILVCLHASVFVTGLVGNALVCLSVLRNKSLQTVTNYYIVNLALADFLVILICLPPTVYWDLTLTWNFGLILCKLVLYLQVSPGHPKRWARLFRFFSASLQFMQCSL